MSDERSGTTGRRQRFDDVMSTLRSRLLDGEYPLHSLLPAERDLAAELGVARDTVRSVLTELANEGWVERRQGSGTRVIRVPEGIRSARSTDQSGQPASLEWFMDQAFARAEVTLDVFTLTAESLNNQLRRLDERIQRGKLEAPQRIVLRMMLPDPDLDMPYPQSLDPQYRDAMRERQRELAEWHSGEVKGRLLTFKARGAVETVDVEIRHVPLTPPFKVYLMNGEEMLQAYYVVGERPLVLKRLETEIQALDALGLIAKFTHFVKDSEDPNHALLVEGTQAWFDSLWKNLAK
ncbi:GntR family transcriptional regulator [Streptomyces sp. NPDC086077]|uniref:GntR family transcriptional regulator n=1 Tax=Streptomyces sp. NPDC086077 TaxID=3154862 RepID=UPI003420AE78